MRSRCAPIAASYDIGSVRDWRFLRRSGQGISLPLKPSGFGGKNREITLEQVAEATNALAWTIWKRTWRSPDEIAARCTYYQPATAPPTKAGNEKPNSKRKPEEAHSAVILVCQRGVPIIRNDWGGPQS